jgi:hypothetical protein
MKTTLASIWTVVQKTVSFTDKEKSKEGSSVRGEMMTLVYTWV